MKLITKIVGATLGLALAVGVGVGVANNNREAKGVYAANTTVASADIVSGTSYKEHKTTDWIITFGGNNASIGTNSGNRSKCNLGSQTKYAVSPVTTSSVASAFVSLQSLSNINGISYTFNGGSSQTSTKVYAIYSSNNSSFSALTLTASSQGHTISSGTKFEFDTCTGYFGLLFEATNDSGNWRIDNVNLTFYEDSAVAPTLTGITKKTAPTQTSYYAGEAFDPSGLVVTLAYDNDTEVDVAYNDHSADFSFSPATITAAGNVEIQYLEYTSMKVTQAVTMVTPYTVPQAISAIENAVGNQIQTAYVSGIVSQVDSYSDQYHSITYWISADGTTTTQLQVYGGKGLNGANFASVDDINLGDQVVVKGMLKKHNDVHEFAQNSKILSLVVAPKVNSISLTPSAITGAPGATGDVDLLFTSIDIDQNENSHKTVGDIEWSSDDDDVIYIDGGEYLVTGNHRESATIKASFNGVVYGSATFTVIDPSVYVMEYDTRTWTEVTDISTLGPGDKVILTGVKSEVVYAAGTYSSGSNVPADTSNTLTVVGNKATGVVSTMIYTLEAGTVDGSVAFKDSSNKYLYAASSSSNNMKSQNDIDGNASFILNSDGTVVAQGSNSRKYMRYNNDSSNNLFSCYASSSTTGTLITFYKFSGDTGSFDLPSYTPITTAFDDGDESYVRLGVQLSEDDWDTIDSEIGITGYGVMLVRETTLTSKGFSTIEDAFRSTSNNKPTLKDLSRASDAAPQDHFIAAKISITLDSNIDVVFCAATYVISSNGSYCFINEVSGSLYDLLQEFKIGFGFRIHKGEKHERRKEIYDTRSRCGCL